MITDGDIQLEQREQFAEDVINAGEMIKRQSEYSGGPMWMWFGLSYASYLVMSRRVLCSMPVDWQEKFVAMLNEVHVVLGDEPREPAGGYVVTAKDKLGKFVKDPMAQYKHVSALPRVGENS